MSPKRMPASRISEERTAPLLISGERTASRLICTDPTLSRGRVTAAAAVPPSATNSARLEMTLA